MLLPELLAGIIGLDVSPEPAGAGVGAGAGAGLAGKTEFELGCMVIGFTTGLTGVVDIGFEVDTEMPSSSSVFGVLVGIDDVGFTVTGFALGVGEKLGVGAGVATGLSKVGITSGGVAGVGTEVGAGFVIVLGTDGVGVIGVGGIDVGAAGFGCQGVAVWADENVGAGFGFGAENGTDGFADTGVAGGVDDGDTVDAGMANGVGLGIVGGIGAEGIEVETGVEVGIDAIGAGDTGIEGIGVAGFGAHDGVGIEVEFGVDVEIGVGAGVGFELGLGQLLLGLNESVLGKSEFGLPKDGGVGGVGTDDVDGVDGDCDADGTGDDVGAGVAGAANGLNGVEEFELKAGLLSNGLLSNGMSSLGLLSNGLFSTGFGTYEGWKFTLTGGIEAEPKFVFGWLKPFPGKLSVAGLLSPLSIFSIGTRPTLAGSF